MSISEDQLPTIVSIDSITPYENNPRKITKKAVNAVRESIERYGWQQPIVVDEAGVIVVGHTRHQAALELGLTEVPVVVMHGDEEKIKEYRLVDNKTGEMTNWDMNSLAFEVREFDQDLIDTFFSGMSLEIQAIESASSPTAGEIAAAAEEALTVKESSDETLHTTDVLCPSCDNRFQVRTRSLPGMTDETIAEIPNGGAE